MSTVGRVGLLRHLHGRSGGTVTGVTTGRGTLPRLHLESGKVKVGGESGEVAVNGKPMLRALHAAVRGRSL
jgi:hypothetical protein